MVWIILVALVLVIIIVRRILQLRSRRKGWMEFQFAAELLLPEQLPKIAAEFKKFIRDTLNTDLDTLNFAEQAEFLFLHIEEMQSSDIECFLEIGLAKHPEQTPWLGMAAYLGELVRAQHPNAHWRKDGGLHEVVIAYPGDPAYPPYSPFADIYRAAYLGNHEVGPFTLNYGFRYMLRAEAFNRKCKLRYTAEEMAALQKTIEEQFGKIRTVWHEIYSPDIHVDIFVVDPPDGSAIHLITGGMGAFMMPIPDDGSPERLELMATLPNDWPLGYRKQKDEKNYWPTRMLKDIARYPVDSGGILGSGHTVQMPKPYGDTRFGDVLLLPPEGKTPEELRYTLSPEVEVGLLQLIPIYPEEREYIMEHREEARELFGEHTRIIDPKRKSVEPS